jgi:hypothetical protein
MHLLTLSFVHALRSRMAPERWRSRSATRLIGIAAIGAERIARSLGLSRDLAGAQRVLELHPLLNPAVYISARSDDTEGRVERSRAHDDGAWIAWCGPTKVAPLQAIVRAVDPTFNVQSRALTTTGTSPS